MITRAIVEEIINDGYKALINIPLLSSSSSSKGNSPKYYTAYATICSMNNSSNLIRKGDIVIIGFEDEDLTKPVIFGQLYRPNIDLEGEIRVGMNLSTLTTSSITKLSSDTTIGNVTSQEIQYLSGLHSIIEDLQTRVADLESRLNSENN